MANKRGKRWVATGYDKATRAKRYLGTFDTKREAEQEEAKWKLRARPTGRETCGDFAERWVDDYPRPRASTNKHNHERIKRFAKDFKGVRLADVDRPGARAWAKKHPSHLSAVRAMFSDAMNDGLVDSNPFSKLRLPGGAGRRNIVALTEKELTGLADTALKPECELGEYALQYRAMILFAGYVGLRPGELYALKRDDLNGQLCTIDKALSSTGEITPPKNGRTRTIIVPPAAQDALLEVPMHPNGLLFNSPTGKRWSQTSHFYYWKTLRREAKLPGLDFYELRHCAATMLLERGVTPWDVAIQLGHTDGGQLVMECYGHPAEDGARARLLAAYDAQTGPTPLNLSGAAREQAV